ncbi:ABC transporter ATP-binding protein [Blastococcus sp. SYSU D00820]
MSGLSLHGVSIARGGLPVVRDVSLEVPAGQVTVLLGPNGAGKTTLLEGVSGALPLTSGRIELDGTDLARTSALKRARAGVAHVEQGRTVFSELTVRENLIAAGGAGSLDRAYELFPRLRERQDSRAVLLSGGEQQMLVIARAVGRDAKVLLLDELSLGLAPVIVRQLMTLVRQLADEGRAVLLVEQFAALALTISDTAHVMQRGSILLSEDAAVLRARPDLLRQAYLSGEADGHGGVQAHGATASEETR